MQPDSTDEFVEDRIPLRSIRERASELVELYGGSVTSAESDSFEFSLPIRRGIAASGEVSCRVRWAEDQDGRGTVTITANQVPAGSRAPRILLLSAGAAGAILWLLWPFFPDIGTLSWIGGAIAFASYFLTLRSSGRGIAYDWLQRLARTQREMDVGKGSDK